MAPFSLGNKVLFISGLSDDDEEEDDDEDEEDDTPQGQAAPAATASDDDEEEDDDDDDYLDRLFDDILGGKCCSQELYLGVKLIAPSGGVRKMKSSILLKYIRYFR